MQFPLKTWSYLHLMFYKHCGCPRASLQPILDPIWHLILQNNFVDSLRSVKFWCWGFHRFLMKGFVKISIYRGENSDCVPFTRQLCIWYSFV